jgi:sugar (pentulose or hexulose) kinase
VVEPDPQRVSVYEEVYATYRELYPALKPSMHRLVQLTSEA